MQQSLNTIEPCVDEARILVAGIKRRLTDTRQQRLVGAFTALAGDDRAIGLLAYYIWRRRARRQT